MTAIDTSKNAVICDVECFQNYFLVTLYSPQKDKYAFVSMLNGEIIEGSIKGLMTVIRKHTVITFNGDFYDYLMISAFVNGFGNKMLKKLSDYIIQNRTPSWKVYREYGINNVFTDTIDIMPICPLEASLKIYAGRNETTLLKDLPMDPDSIITETDLHEIKFYCQNDVKMTYELYQFLQDEINLRIVLSNEYGIDLRSKADAQIAEAVIKAEMSKLGNIKPARARASYSYIMPANIKLTNPDCIELAGIYQQGEYRLNATGHVYFTFPDGKSEKTIKIGNTSYTCGIGGLHSNEKSTTFYSDDTSVVKDADVASYYPNTILRNRYAPEHLGEVFLRVYQGIVTRRLEAKAKGDKNVANSLKIVINSSFGKFGSKYSSLYAPNLVIQTTITGQLTLLMLIERLENAGISVISANTDGIVSHYLRNMEETYVNIIHQWEKETGYSMELTEYSVLASRDVNNYIAIKPSGAIKGKGKYADPSDHYNRLRKNPDAYICVDAVKKYMLSGTPIAETIRNHQRIEDFLTLRKVSGGAVFEGAEIGKAIRWYHSSESLECLFYSDKASKTVRGNKVGSSDDVIPLLQLPASFPSDIDYDWYIDRAEDILQEIGVK